MVIKSTPIPAGDSAQIPVGFLILFIIAGMFAFGIIVAFCWCMWCGGGLGENMQRYRPCPELASDRKKRGVIAVDMTQTTVTTCETPITV